MKLFDMMQCIEYRILGGFWNEIMYAWCKPYFYFSKINFEARSTTYCILYLVHVNKCIQKKLCCDNLILFLMKSLVMHASHVLVSIVLRNESFFYSHDPFFSIYIVQFLLQHILVKTKKKSYFKAFMPRSCNIDNFWHYQEKIYNLPCHYIPIYNHSL